MTKPSTDTITEQKVAEFRRNLSDFPDRLTLRFLALLTKRELEILDRKLFLLWKNKPLPGAPDRRRFYRESYQRVQSERIQRKHIKAPKR